MVISKKRLSEGSGSLFDIVVKWRIGVFIQHGYP